MLYQKQWLFEIFSVNSYDTQVCKGETSVCKAKISRQINDIRDTRPETENTDHCPDMGFYH